MATLPFIYLDHAAATPLDERVLAAMQPYFSEQFFNPSATYLAAKNVARKLGEARGDVAHWLGARSSEIIFTAGGTEANNLAIDGIMRQFPDGNIVVSAIEHESVLAPARQYNCREVGVLPDGTIDLAALEQAIDNNTVLVSVMYANNEIGTVQPLKDVARIIHEKRVARLNRSGGQPLYFHTDACQAANYLDLHVTRLGVDLMTLNGGKIYGPKQSGALFVSAQVHLQPSILGGGQERNLRSGTENVAACIGFATALTLVQEARHNEVKRLQLLQHDFFTALLAAVPNLAINGSQKRRLPNNVHVTIPGHDNERLLMQLDEAGILAAAGSACSASDEEPSHVLRAIGLDDAAAQASLRFTMGHGTVAQDIDKTIAALRSFVV
jgi:cysteine desulfurase